MTTYTFSQLEGLWIQAGGSKTLAPLMAGVAEVESGGNPQAYNPSGASGLWQIEVPLHNSIIPGGAGNVFNPQANAKAAVTLSGNTMAGIQSNWLAFEPSGAAEAIAKKNGGTTPASSPTVQQYLGGGPPPGVAAPGNQSTNVSTPNNTAASSSDLTGLLGPIKNLLHAVATVIDYAFSMFQPGQGPRFLFALLSLAAVLMAFKVLAPSGGIPHGW